MTAEVTDNAGRSRFELKVDGQVVFAEYRRMDGRLAILHVEAPPPLRGTGAAGRLMEGIAAQARAEGAKLTPLCGYAAAWLRRHKAHADLLG
jgi:predicted GNAT family acetyltransferase